MRPGGGGNEAYMASADLESNSALADVFATADVVLSIVGCPTDVHSTVLNTPNPFMTYVLPVWVRTNVVPDLNFVDNRCSTARFWP